MGGDTARISAIVAAVHAYMKAQEEEKERQRLVNSARRTSLWSLAGRQEIMSQRQLWQLKIFNGNQLQRSAFLKTGMDPHFFKPKGKIPVLLNVNE